MRRAIAAVGVLGATVGCGAGGRAVATAPAASGPRGKAAVAQARDWPTFGRTPSRPGSSDASTGITATGAATLRRRTVELPGTVDSSPIFLAGVPVAGARHDTFLMTTTYGRTLAVDAHSGRLLWTYAPPGLGRWEGSYRITNATPVASADRRFVFAASPDGRVHKLSVAHGREAGGRWPVAITRLPEREKVAASLNRVGERLVVATGGYIGDQPPYQAHVVTMDAGSGRVEAVFNALCADRHRLLVPSTCPESGAAIWARAGVVAAPDGSLLVATGDGRFDGRRHLGDSILRLSASGRRILGSWTPANADALEATDADLGSAGPVLIGGGSVLQSGKDARLHVVAFAALRHRGSQGHERQVLRAPGGQAMVTAPAVWRHGARTFVFATTYGATAAYEQRGGRLRPLWENGTPGTSPIVAGGLLYVYDPGGALVVYRPVTGRRVARLPAGGGHWSSPVPGTGVIALPEGDANQHRRTGTLSLYSR